MPCPYIDECGYKPMSLTMKEINPEHQEGFCSDDAAYAGCCWFVNRISVPVPKRADKSVKTKLIPKNKPPKKGDPKLSRRVSMP